MSALRVSTIERIPIEIPFRDVPKRNMQRELPHWNRFELFEVELESGDVGYGESMTYYTWGSTSDEDIELVVGTNAAKAMWDDTIGAGLQMALFDAVGKAKSVPAYALMGDRCYDEVPLSWWCIDMPPEDWLAECKTAIDHGYTVAKLKGRPWFDIREQLELLSRELPEWFLLDVDFNETLLTAEKAIPLLRELEEYPQVGRIETPIPQEDIRGNERIRDSIESDLVLHYGSPDPIRALHENVVDGFVLMGGVSQIRREASVASAADRPSWLQLVGSELTAAFSIHCNAVLDSAEWSAINCHQLFAESPANAGIDVTDGRAVVPDEPGIGVEVDRDAIERFRIEDQSRDESSEQSLDADHSEFYLRMQTRERYSPKRLIESRWADGTRMYFCGENDQLLRYAQEEGNMPYFERGVETRLIPDDGSDRWETIHQRAREEPVVFEPGSDTDPVTENRFD